MPIFKPKTKSSTGTGTKMLSIQQPTDVEVLSKIKNTSHKEGVFKWLSRIKRNLVQFQNLLGCGEPLLGLIFDGQVLGTRIGSRYEPMGEVSGIDRLA